AEKVKNGDGRVVHETCRSEQHHIGIDLELLAECFLCAVEAPGHDERLTHDEDTAAAARHAGAIHAFEAHRFGLANDEVHHRVRAVPVFLVRRVRHQQEGAEHLPVPTTHGDDQFLHTPVLGDEMSDDGTQ